MKAKARTGAAATRQPVDSGVEAHGGPSEAQLRYLQRGLREPGGKLPLFDEQGREIPHRTIETCLSKGWAETWARNPVKPDWMVCRLTEAGYRVLGRTPPQR